ncbi:MAG TPA: ATP-binding protein [Thermoanaerobaculia bacterium]
MIDDKDNAQSTPVLPVSGRTSSLQDWLDSGDAYRHLLRSIQDYAIFLIDLEGRVASWNPGAARLLGYREEEILGHAAARFFTPEEIEKGVPEGELKTAAEQHRASDDRWHVRKDGTYFFASGIATPVHDDEDALRAFCKVMRDRTDWKRQEEELRNQAEALSRADQEKNEFLAVLAHELRNPLAPIFYALRILEQDDPSLRHNARAIIERQVQRLARMIDDLLDVNRISTGKIELRREAVTLRGLVAHAAETARPLFEARRQDFSVCLPEEEIWLNADAARLEQVLSNLLHNAAKFTGDGGAISLTAERPDDYIVVRVTDNGTGIPPDLLPHIFDLFKQGSRSLDRPQGGLGIGLTLSRQLVEMHGGSIEAHSSGTGQGSEFMIRLPVIPRAAEPDARPEAPVPSPARPLRILVVDDNEDTAEMMSLLLELEGHDVQVAHSGPSALEAAAARRPDVIVLDIGLPGLDGYQVAQRLRQDPAFKDVILIAASGYGQEADRRRSWEAGFDHHLVKPVDPGELRRLLVEAGGGRGKDLKDINDLKDSKDGRPKGAVVYVP